MKALIKKACLSLVIGVALVGCWGISEPLSPEDQPFFDLPNSKRDETLASYPLERQIDLMVVARTCCHPPLNFLGIVCRDREPLVPLLMQRVAESDKMYNLRTLTLCLYDIDRWHFKWTDEPKYVDMWKVAVARKADPEIRKEVLAIFETGDPFPFFEGINYDERKGWVDLLKSFLL